MDKATQGAEAKDQNAPSGQAEGVNNSPAPEKEVSTASDFESELERLKAEKAKILEERENYKKGMLSAKSKLKELKKKDDLFDDEDSPAGIDDIIDQKVTEKLLERQESLLLQKENEIIQKMAKENRELKTALANRSQIGNVSVGGGSSKPDIETEFFSAKQIEDLKARGFDDKKIELLKKNLSKPR